MRFLTEIVFATHKIMCYMINSCKSTKEINAFQYVAIPSPRDIFSKYGERISDRGVYTCGADEAGVPQLVSSSSVIDQMVNAQSMLNIDCAK